MEVNKVCIGPGGLVETTLHPSAVIVTYRHDWVLRSVSMRIEVDMKNGGAISREIPSIAIETGNLDLVRMHGEQMLRSLERWMMLEPPPYKPPNVIARDINSNPFKLSDICP